MKKVSQVNELRPEYRRTDLGRGIRGKYFDSYRWGTNLVLPSPDVAKVFPTEKEVNEALLSLINLAEKAAGMAKSTNGRNRKVHAE